MDPLVAPIALVVAFLGGTAIFEALGARRARTRKALAEAWRRAAEACGLAHVRWSDDTVGGESDLIGESDGLLVRFQASGAGKAGTHFRITDARPGRAPSLTLRREDVGSAWRKGRGFREVQIGDPEFDEAVFIDGPHTLARAVLDVATRRIVRGLLSGTETLPSGVPAWMSITHMTFERGELGVDVDAPSAREVGRVLRDALPALLDAARRLRPPDDVAGRLALTARSEPRAEARLQDLLTLAREFPAHHATRKDLRAALKDGDEEIRLRGAIALEGEGHPTLVELACDRGTDESCAARAIAALGTHMPLDRAQKVLKHALRKRRLPVAAAALEALALRHEPELIPTIAEVLREDDELAVSAAGALGRSGRPEAEPPLMEALGRDRDLCIAAARALGRLGSVAAVAPLKEAMARHGDKDVERAVRQAIAEIQSRIQGATPGQLSLAEGGTRQAGQLTLADDEAGQLSLSEKPPR